MANDKLPSARALQNFWNETAKQYGKNGYKAVLNPTSKGILNWYTDYLHQRALNRFLTSFKDKRVLEIGSGVGRWSIRLAQAGAHVTGFDISQEMINETKRNILHKDGIQNIDLVEASVHSLPFASNSFDIVISITVLQHIVDKKKLDKIAHEIIRVLKSEGQIILLEIAPKKEEPVFLSFPTIYISPKTWINLFTDHKPATLICQQGVSLSLFLKPFDYLLKKFSRYSTKLFTQWKPSLRYKILSNSFYIGLNLAIILSIPFDLLLTQHFTYFTNTKVFVFQKD